MSIDLRRLLLIFSKRKWSALFAFLAVGIVGAVVYASATPKFDGYTMVYAGDNPRDAAGEASQIQEQRMASLVAIGETDDVRLRAAENVGVDVLFPSPKTSAFWDGIKKALPAGIWEMLAAQEQPDRSPVAIAYQLSKFIRLSPEGKTNLLRIVARHENPLIAAKLSDAVATALIERQIELRERPGAVTFFEQQRARFDERVKQASTELATYVAANKTYSVVDQRQFLLKRASELSSALTTTKGNIAAAVGQREALTDQLRRLRPVTQSPFVTGLVDALGAPAARQSNGRSSTGEGNFSGDPPLLLVKVYQDGLVALLKVNSEIGANTKLLDSLTEAFGELDRQLADLSSKEETFERLKKAVEVSASNAEIYGRRIVEEQINADLAAAKMSTVRIAQAALTPRKPAYPTLRVFGALVLGGGLFAAVGLALFFEWSAGGFDEHRGPLFTSKTSGDGRAELHDDQRNVENLGPRGLTTIVSSSRHVS